MDTSFHTCSGTERIAAEKACNVRRTSSGDCVAPIETATKSAPAAAKRPAAAASAASNATQGISKISLHQKTRPVWRCLGRGAIFDMGRNAEGDVAGAGFGQFHGIVAGTASIGADDETFTKFFARLSEAPPLILAPGEMHAVGPERSGEAGIVGDKRGGVLRLDDLDQGLDGLRLERAAGVRTQQNACQRGRFECGGEAKPGFGEA